MNNMNTTRRLVFDTGWAMSSSLVAMGIGFVLNLVIGNRFGPEGLGIFSMSIAIYNISATIGAFGVHSALIKYAAEFQDDQSELNALASAALLTSTALGLLSGSVLLLLSTPLSIIFRMPDLRVMLTVLALGLLFFLPNKTLLGLLNGLRIMRTYAICESLRYATAIVLVLLTFTVRIGLQGIAWAIAGAEIIVFAILWYKSRSLFRFSLHGFRQQSRRLFRFGTPVLLAGMLGQVNAQVASLVVGYFLGEGAVGIYAVALMFARGLLIIPSAIQKITAPAISYLHSKKQSDAVAELVREAMKYSFILLSLASIALVLLGDDLIRLLYPSQPEFLAAAVPLHILLGPVMLYGAIVAVGATHSSVGRPGLGLWLAAPALVLNSVLNLMLVPRLGINGSACATGAVFCLNMLLSMVMLNYVLKISLNIRQLALTFALGLGAYLAAVALAPSLGWLATGLLVTGAYLVVLILTDILNRRDHSRILALLRRD